MVIDVHAHVFPYLGEASGFDSVRDHLMYFQKVTASSSVNVIRRVEDSTVVAEGTLWDENEPGPEGAFDVNFRVGRFGRLEWTSDGADYYVQFFAPSLQEMAASPEFMLAQMDYAGVDIAVLQNPSLYGELNGHIAQAVAKYPNRFIGQVHINEVESHRVSQIEELRRAVSELDLVGGLYYANSRFWENGYQDHIDDEKFFPLWEEVRGLGITAFWDITAVPDPERPRRTGLERYLDQMRRFGDWLQRFPEIPVVLVHGVQLPLFCIDGSYAGIPDEIWDVWRMPNVHLEILFPIQVSYPQAGASRWEYPYPQVQPIIRDLYEKLGPEKLLWGTDMPNVERNCTYKQSLEYLVNHCTFITPDHMNLITCDNAARLLGLGPPGTRRR